MVLIKGSLSWLLMILRGSTRDNERTWVAVFLRLPTLSFSGSGGGFVSGNISGFAIIIQSIEEGRETERNPANLAPAHAEIVGGHITGGDVARREF